MKNPKKPKNAEAPCITAIAKDTAFIWVRNGKKGKPTQKAVERGFRVRFKSIEIGSSKNKDVHVYIQGKAWSTPFDERLLSGEVRHTPSKIKTVWVLPREWCWVVGRVPDVTVEWSLVDFGYQVDTYSEGDHVRCCCRDLGGSHKVSKMQEWLIEQVEVTAAALRKKFP